MLGLREVCWRLHGGGPVRQGSSGHFRVGGGMGLQTVSDSLHSAPRFSAQQGLLPVHPLTVNSGQ